MTYAYYEINSGKIAAYSTHENSFPQFESILVHTFDKDLDKNFYVADGLLTPRPTPKLDFNGSFLDLSSLPANTLVTISNEIGDLLEVDDMQQTVELTDAGYYDISVKPPFPYKHYNTRIEI